jgi:transcriptional regulator with XRE-family HTH domain
METLGGRLRRLRDARGMAIADLARTVGASEGSIRQMETGNVKSPGLLLGIRLADALGVDPRYLAFGEDPVRTRLDEVERRLAVVERRLGEMARRR